MDLMNETTLYGFTDLALEAHRARASEGATLKPHAVVLGGTEEQFAYVGGFDEPLTLAGLHEMVECAMVVEARRRASAVVLFFEGRASRTVRSADGRTLDLGDGDPVLVAVALTIGSARRYTSRVSRGVAGPTAHLDLRPEEVGSSLEGLLPIGCPNFVPKTRANA